MDIKQWLMRGYKTDREIETLREEKERAYNELFIPSAGDGEKVQTSPKNVTEERYMRYLEYDRRLEERLNELCEIKIEINDFICTLPDTTLRTLLYKRYVLYEHWDAIAAELNYDERHIYKLHKKALQVAAEKNKTCHTMP